MNSKITIHTLPYPANSRPDYIVPKEYESCRYAIGHIGEQVRNPLVAICMNPSAARDDWSDRTVNRIISISKITGKDGWLVFNTYPERATNANDIEAFDEKLSDKNLKIIREFLLEHDIKEVWAAWGDDKGIEPLAEGKKRLTAMLREINVRIYYYGTLTKAGNPRHPLQRIEKWNFTDQDKHYLSIEADT